jgi:hypothetical protein
MSGAEAQLSAQATLVTSTSTSLALLPNAPSFEAAFQADSPQSSSETQSSSTSLATPTEPQAVPIKGPLPNYRPFKVREKLYLFDLIGPGAFVVAGIQAGVDQSRTLKVPYPPDGFVGPGNHPAHGAIPEWGEGADGYAKRYASRFGQELAGTTIRYGLGELLQEDVTYHRCTCTGVVPRISHAFVYSLVAYTKNGRAVPSLPAIVSPFLASEIAVKAWYPARYNTSDALRTSANVYYTLPFKNLFYEFRKR